MDVQARIDEILYRHETYMHRMDSIAMRLRLQTAICPVTLEEYQLAYFRLANLLEELGEVGALVGGLQVEMADAVLTFIREMKDEED